MNVYTIHIACKFVLYVTFYVAFYRDYLLLHARNSLYSKMTRLLIAFRFDAVHYFGLDANDNKITEFTYSHV